MRCMNAHDAPYRRLFSDKPTVADLIRGFIRQPWVNDLDLETLERVSGSFVSARFQKRENDVIWRVRLRGDWLYVYLLIEFQSTVDRFMALRLMVYVGLLYQRLLAERQIGRGDFLPPVLPIVLYNGTARWSAPLDVVELMAACPESLAEYRPRMRYFLLDEHAQDDAELAGMRNLAALVFRFEKCRTRADFAAVINAFQDWAAVPEHGESLKLLARWVELIISGGRLTGKSVLVLEDIQECGTMLKERVKQWERELRTEGKAEGKAEGEAEVLLRLLGSKFGALPDPLHARVKAADSQQILAWAERILTATKIEDVFEA